MSSKHAAPDLPKALRMIDQAIRNGTHSAASRHVCHGCRQEVASIYHTTFDKRRLCATCADLMGEGPKAYEARFNRQLTTKGV